MPLVVAHHRPASTSAASKRARLVLATIERGERGPEAMTVADVGAALPPGRAARSESRCGSRRPVRDGRAPSAPCSRRPHPAALRPTGVVGHEAHARHRDRPREHRDLRDLGGRTARPRCQRPGQFSSLRLHPDPPHRCCAYSLRHGAQTATAPAERPHGAASSTCTRLRVGGIEVGRHGLVRAACG
jgi:hypothetical protein